MKTSARILRLAARFRSALLAVALGLVVCVSEPSRLHAEALDCDVDDALANAAGALLLEGTAPRSERLVSAVREAGSDAVLVHALFSADPNDGEAARWLAELRTKSDARLACGQADSERGSLLIASARGGTLLPLTAASSVVRGTLAPGFSRAELVIADANGKLVRLGLAPQMLHDGVPLSLDLARPATIQLVARGSAGPRPVAERVLPSLVASTPEEQGAPREATVGNDSRLDLQAMVNALREAKGAQPVRENRLLAHAAAQHAKDVCSDGRLAHELLPGADPEARLARAGVRAKLVGETIARAQDARTAFDRFQESPSHLLTLLERRFTDAGVGTAKDASGRTCLVVMLASWPRYVGR